MAYDYRWLPGHNQHLEDLIDFADDILIYTRPRRIYPVSPDIDVFPVRDAPLSGGERGDGQVDHYWEVTVQKAAHTYILNEYLAGGTITEAPMTIYTPLHELDIWQRFNCILIRPTPTDTVRLSAHVYRVRYRLNKLEAL